MRKFQKIFITGGGGYVGSKLVPELLAIGYEIVVLDLFIYGDHVLPSHDMLRTIKGDIRDTELVAESMKGCDAVIHLACISNDPSFELNPSLGRSINLNAFEPLVKHAKDAGVKRFIYASSSSVYGIKQEERVTEDLSLEPLTDYSKYKAQCEEILQRYSTDSFTTLTVRPSTVCGYAPRLRLDVIVNILTAHAIVNREIKVFGGTQYRPNIHIDDMVDFYVQALIWDDHKINGEIFNVGYLNYTVQEIADMVLDVVGSDVKKKIVATNDNRSYRVCCDRIYDRLGFKCSRTIQSAIQELLQSFNSQIVSNALNEARYYNIKTMQQIDLA